MVESTRLPLFVKHYPISLLLIGAGAKSFTVCSTAHNRRLSQIVKEIMQYPYLISRTLDPLFGVAMGVALYYLYEQRAERPQGHTLLELLKKKYGSKESSQ